VHISARSCMQFKKKIFNFHLSIVNLVCKSWIITINKKYVVFLLIDFLHTVCIKSNIRFVRDTQVSLSKDDINTYSISSRLKEVQYSITIKAHQKRSRTQINKSIIKLNPFIEILDSSRKPIQIHFKQAHKSIRNPETKNLNWNELINILISHDINLNKFVAVIVNMLWIFKCMLFFFIIS
jgi:hypothetical protein